MDKASVGTKSLAIGNVLPQELWIYKISGGKSRLKWEIAIAKNERSLYPDKNQSWTLFSWSMDQPSADVLEITGTQTQKAWRTVQNYIQKYLAWYTDFKVTVICTHTYICTYTCVHIYTNI